MEKNLEIEFKALLTKKQYDELLPRFAGITPYEQINYYFDTRDERLLAKRNMLRVRFKNNKYELTLKRMGEVGLDEFNEPIDEERYNKLKNGIYFDSEVLKLVIEDGIPFEELVPNYSLKTTRYDLDYLCGVLSLDHSEYLDTEDFELEYEVSDREEGLKIYKELTESIGIHYEMNCHGKRHRVYDRLYQLRMQKKQ